MPYFPNYVGDHSHLGKVQQPIRCKVWSSLLYETEVGQVHAQVRDAGWITPVQHFAHRSKSAIGTNDGLQFCYRLFDLFKFDYWLPFSTPNYLLLTVFGTLSQVFFSLYTAALVKAAQIWRTPLKLCKHRQISATAVHFSMAATLDAILLLLVKKKKESQPITPRPVFPVTPWFPPNYDYLDMISEETNRDPSLNRLVISIICSARDFLSAFIQAWPRNSLVANEKR